MKLTIISPGRLPVPPVKGGAVETLIYNLIEKNSINNDFKIELFGCGDEEICNFKVLGCKFYLFNKSKILEYIFKFLPKRLNKIKEDIEEQRYIKYINKNISKSDYILIENRPDFINRIRVKTGSKVLLHLHNSHISSYNKEVFEKYSGILTVSQYLKSEIIKVHGIDENKIKVWHNCVSDNFISYYENNNNLIKYKLKIKDNDFVVAFVGRIVEEKGVYELVEALKRINIINIKLLIIGSGWFGSDLKTEYINKVEESSKEIQDRIIFTGYVQHEFIPSYLQACDIVVLPSLWNEPFGLTIVEAMAMGKAVITTKKGGIPEIFNGNDGILLTEDDLIKNISENILYYYHNPKQKKEVGLNAKNTVLNNFTVIDYYNRFKRIIVDI